MPRPGKEVNVIDATAPLMSHDHLYRLVRDVMGDHGLIVVGMGKAGERGFQMLYRFSDICDRLEACGINVIFVYPKESVRHVFDATSIRAARYRGKPCLFLDEDGRFFRRPVHARSLRAVHLDPGMRQTATADVPVHDETWDPQLRTFFADVIGRCLH
jgi:hypothetical protein